jgi:hypothetical protein
VGGRTVRRFGNLKLCDNPEPSGPTGAFAEKLT